MKFKVRAELGTLLEDEQAENLKELGFKAERWDLELWVLVEDEEADVEINTIEELVQFIEKHGRVVISGNVISIHTSVPAFEGMLERDYDF